MTLESFQHKVQQRNVESRGSRTQLQQLCLYAASTMFNPQIAQVDTAEANKTQLDSQTLPVGYKRDETKPRRSSDHMQTTSLVKSNGGAVIGINNQVTAELVSSADVIKVLAWMGGQRSAGWCAAMIIIGSSYKHLGL